VARSRNMGSEFWLRGAVFAPPQTSMIERAQIEARLFEVALVATR